MTPRTTRNANGDTDMTRQDIQDAITDLMKARREISRVNIAAGRAVFNPAAKDALEAVIDRLHEELEE